MRYGSRAKEWLIDQILSCGEDGSSQFQPCRTPNDFARSVISLKHYGFSHEEEVRLFVEGGTVEFRARASGLVPYVRLALDQSAVRCVRVGPRIDRRAEKMVVERFLRLRGYDAEVSVSRLPYRPTSFAK